VISGVRDLPPATLLNGDDGDLPTPTASLNAFNATRIAATPDGDTGDGAFWAIQCF
jgi:hypothetical protein